MLKVDSCGRYEADDEFHQLVNFDFFVFFSGDSNSRVFGSLLDGVFDGRIHMSDGTAYTVVFQHCFFKCPKHVLIYMSI